MNEIDKCEVEKIIPTKLDVFDIQFDVDTPRFLKEVIENSGQTMYAVCWNIFRNYLIAITTRAAELNDPILNVIMLRLNLYEVPNEQRKEIIEKIRCTVYNHKKTPTISKPSHYEPNRHNEEIS